MTLQISNRTTGVTYLGESPLGTSNDYEISYASDEPYNSVRLDANTLNKVGIPSLSPNTDWAVALSLNYLTSSGVEGTFDLANCNAELKFYDYRTGNAVCTRSTEQLCTISGSPQMEIDADDRVICRWKHDDINPAPIGNYKFALFIENSENKDLGCSGFITVVV